VLSAAGPGGLGATGAGDSWAHGDGPFGVFLDFGIRCGCLV